MLGGLMLDNSSWTAVSSVLISADFYRHDHQIIYDAISDLLGNGEAADAVTVSEILASKDLTRSTGGLAYLAELVRDTPSTANVGAYAKIIRERSALRGVIALGAQLLAKGYDPEGRESQEILADAERRIVEIGRSERAPGRVTAAPLVWAEPSAIEPRQWVYGRHYMRGMVSATAGVGGAGKSSIINVELVSMAIGRDLLRGGTPLPLGPLCVWGHNGEDPYIELQRRVMAVCQHYGVTREDLGGRLRITSGREVPIMMAQLPAGAAMVIPTEACRQVAAQITEHKIQVLVLDPFVTTYIGVSENDNPMVDQVMRVLRDVADSTGCAIEVAHHMRKLNGDEPTVDSIRGASSIIGAARSARIVAAMTKEDAQKFSIPDEHRGYYSWLQNAKANMLPPAHKRRWLRMESVSLGNAQGPYEADEIGVVAAWDPPELEVSLSGPEFRQLRALIIAADPVSKLRADTRSTGWIGYLIADAMRLDPKDPSVRSQMVSIIAKLEAQKCLVRDSVYDPIKGRNTPVVKWSQELDSE